MLLNGNEKEINWPTDIIKYSSSVDETRSIIEPTFHALLLFFSNIEQRAEIMGAAGSVYARENV